MTDATGAAELRPLQVEMNGINVISESERKGHPRPAGRYGDIRWAPVAAVVVATGIGWGLVTNTSASWLTWQGYLLGPFGLGGKTGAWAAANLGVLVALAIGFVAHLVFGRADVRAEEAAPLPMPATAEA